MCGIAGYYSFGSKKPEKEVIESLFTSIQERGKDASGIAFVDGTRKKLIVFKKDMPAEGLIKQDYWKKLTLPKIMIMHTRASTKGSEKVNTNNHPIFNKEGIAIVHNGVISNDDYLFKHYNFKRDAQVDSEIILRLVEKKWWESIQDLEGMAGNFASAMINCNKPDELIIVKHNNPVNLYMDIKNDILYFASLEQNLKSAFSTYHRGIYVKADITSHAMADDEALLINKEGVSDLKSLKVSPLKEPYIPTNRSYGNDKHIEWMHDNKHHPKHEVVGAIREFYTDGRFDHAKWQAWQLNNMTEEDKKKYAERAKVLKEKEGLLDKHVQEVKDGATLRCKACQSDITDWENSSLWAVIDGTVYCRDCLKELLAIYTIECPICYGSLDLDEITTSFCTVCSSQIPERQLEFGKLKVASPSN